MAKNKKNKGFTLIEVIVVIAILAILASIAVPAITGYIEETNRTSDLVYASNIMDATKIAVVTTNHGLPKDHYIEVVWACGATNEGGEYDSMLFVREPKRVSVFNTGPDAGLYTPYRGESKSYKIIAESVFEFMNATNVTISTSSGLGYGYYAQINDAKSIAANESSFAFHINVSTGEIVLANWDKEDVNDWVDFGLDLEKAPY